MPIFKKPPFRGNADKKRDMPEGLWHKCPGCGEVIHELELKKSLRVCPHCNYHFTLSAPERIESITDPGTFTETDKEMASVDALNFKGYKEKLTKYQKITGLSEAIITGKGKIIGNSVVLAVMDFRFLGASMGSVVGEKITRAIELATKEKTAVIIISASGGARMHEGILSLMQMAKTSGALAVHDRAGLPFISVLTHPTTGGVTASFATLGDMILAEPGCMIGFAGPRVIKETTHQELPDGFQTAEFMHEHGLVDMIVERREMRERLASILGYLLPE
ncbi:MAG: acetyl-CoA carboxylase, carboxyltransferase subunit beta [Verrucomicrobiota bacterium]|jgi:acetyl-CoA carboxylase carboxyl transferase subunit beta|nr:acetyl-CoA carboxylase carboxyl transferase subunit beta [Verrucomicrobiales bacterium]MBB26551.1 acetyl-CoA carboxylase carboxyl transferase subunit beta [Verrucomicrobiaceae bacterium]MBN77852.1 acetyl-CoA carboxylase carboxyl transferase subunit beta [Verrucomicrobiaceae bacterium]MED5260432.1 acetyl-CoA carboxylase, carboxyltransferase subunit beta [Verrucomicrobiota bacterium]MED5456398.1 acetyl-CoA carboxylase, carboxyltransferase subunit beta [Verrucomicrobiota bacterium]|tara:strand:- start:909 stop:1742 length:834 start_codon:yes stop_codon:yes gene_type:complete